MSFNGELCLPLAAMALPLVHRTTVRVRDDVISVPEKHGAEKCVLIADQRTQRRLRRPHLRLRVALPENNCEIKRAAEQLELRKRLASLLSRNPLDR